MKKLCMVIVGFIFSVSSLYASHSSGEPGGSLHRRKASFNLVNMAACQDQDQKSEQSPTKPSRRTSGAFRRPSKPAQKPSTDGGNVAGVSHEDERVQDEPHDGINPGKSIPPTLIAVSQSNNDDGGPRSPFERRGYYPCTYKTDSDEQEYVAPLADEDLVSPSAQDADGEAETDSEDEDGSNRVATVVDAAVIAARKVRAFDQRKAKQKERFSNAAQTDR